MDSELYICNFIFKINYLHLFEEEYKIAAFEERRTKRSILYTDPNQGKLFIF